jgi:ribonuclease HI
MSAEYFCYTDGSCRSGEFAPGGWGFCIRPPQGPLLEGWGSATKTLAKVMEYTAVAEALEALPAGARATVFSDNQSLVENCRRHLEGWRQRGWAKVDPAIVEIVKRIDALVIAKQLVLTWQWIRGHNGNPGNDRADELATMGAREARAALKEAGLLDLHPRKGRS